ncbi:MAG: helix-turn-helix domain-containing protein [Candidatus Symbiothrix sp.]|jgi:ligand-binding sensor domain-containing protein/AraC-like DNA-binding protein|nr:helix-turn-helix domain-containing protein [Candidatus Symbiothrix sp.]
MHGKFLYGFLFSFLFVFCLHGQKADYHTFENIVLSADASAINCFAQDYQGLIWMGSNRGLYSYDGFSAQAHTSIETNNQVYCILILNKSHLCLGTDNGVFFYNYQTDQSEPSGVVFPTDVRTMTVCDSILWIGSLKGLFRYHLQNHTLENIPANESSGLPHQTIYSIIQSDHTLYIGTYNGFCKYVPGTGKFEKIALPSDFKRSNQFINVLLEDTLRKCIWIGTEGTLYKYVPAQNRAEALNHFRNNSVKSLAIDPNENLLVGTDNGLYVYDEESNSVQHIVHDSRNDKSLSNNIIWSIFSDRERNSWLGTDYNISLARYNKAFQFIPISRITGIGNGNRFHALFRDSRKNFWLGGTNGLIFAPSLNHPETSIWYRMGDSNYPISHNRIRQIYEDKDHQLWIASDGSISRYDYPEKQFVHYSIIDSTHTYNSNWAYDLFEDDRGRLWIATCLGGIFVVDKQRLMQSTGVYVAERNYTVQDGLSGSFVNRIAPDKKGNVWVLFYKNGVNKIDVQENKITKILLDAENENNQPDYILCDNEGFIWIGFPNGLIRMDPENNQSKFIRLNLFNTCEILSMVEEGRHLWISTTEGVWIVDKQTEKVQNLNIVNNLFTAGFYDPTSGKIYLGASDELALFSPSLLQESEINAPVILTALYVNGELYHPENLSVRYLNEIKLNYKQNNLILEFSDLQYYNEQGNKFVYRLEGIDTKWNILKQQTNRISYQNVEYGKYRLIISKLDSSGEPSDTPFVFMIRITPPWYYTTAAKCIYILLIAGLLLWIFIFFRMRNNLRIERIEREKTLEFSNLKIDFYNNVSHEFKTPLNLIINPLRKLLPDIKDNNKKIQLESVMQNALNLNELIQQQLKQKITFETLTTLKPVEITSPDEKFLSEMTGIIEDRISDLDLNVNSLSILSGMGSKQIYRKIKQLTGKSPVEYIRSIRLKKAAMLLSQNKFTVSEVMYMVGFSSPSYFSKCFQAEFGKSPKKYPEE